MVSPIILKDAGGPKFFFNIDYNVGPNCPNRGDDVQLVQLGYHALARNPISRAPDAVRQAAAKVVPGAVYSGGANDPLTLAIKAHEAYRGGPQDGHVSVVHGATGGYGGDHAYLLVPLINCLNDTMRRDFPRLDKHPLCPGELRVSVLKILLGGVG